MSPPDLNLLIALDQGCNTCLAGDPDETISSRVGKAALQGKRWALIAQRLIDALFHALAGQDRHCFNAIEWDEA